MNYRDKIIEEITNGLAESTLKNINQLSKAAGLKYSQVYDFIEGRTQMINPESLDKIRTALREHTAGEESAPPIESYNLSDLEKDVQIMMMAVAMKNGVKADVDRFPLYAKRFCQELIAMREAGYTDEKPTQLAVKLFLEKQIA